MDMRLTENEQRMIKKLDEEFEKVKAEFNKIMGIKATAMFEIRGLQPDCFKVNDERTEIVPVETIAVNQNA
jgi:hypothetical protein